MAEWKSWKDENDILELVDMRTLDIQNYITGRWVMTIKRDKDGSFQKCKARWVLRGFQDTQHWNLQTDSPTATRPGFRLQCQAAANNNWDIVHIDLKTAFLQGEAYDETRNVICQIPPEAGYPPYMGARLKKPAYGLKDAPRKWWNRLDAALRSYGLVPTRADRCCYILYTPKATKKAHFVDHSDLRRPDPELWEANLTGHGRGSDTAEVIKTWEATENAWKVDLRQENQLDLEGALELLMDPITGSKAHGNNVEGAVSIHVDDAFMSGSSYFHKKVADSLRKEFQVGSEDLNDVMFVGQRVKWLDRQDGKKRHIRVDQEVKVEEMSEIQFDKSLKDDVACTKDLHTHSLGACLVRSIGYSQGHSFNPATPSADAPVRQRHRQ